MFHHQYYNELEDLDPETTYYWLDLVAVDQHQSADNTTPITPEVLKTMFESSLLGTTDRRVVCVCMPWDRPVYFGRCWCLYEFFTAVEHGLDYKIVFPPAQRAELVRQITRNYKVVLESLSAIDVGTAEAREPRDRESILQAVRSGVGEAEVNFRLKRAVREWVVATAVEAARDLMAGVRQNPTSHTADTARTLTGLGALFNEHVSCVCFRVFASMCLVLLCGCGGSLLLS